jgi:Ras-related protein Rab-23
MEDINLTMKFIVVGNGRIGKTSLICRFVKGIYSDEYKKTLGVAFLEKYEYVKNVDTDVNYLIWDTAG